MSMKDRGFASMERSRQREIASKGGRAAHLAGAHEWTKETAGEAGRKGGLASAASRRRRRDMLLEATADDTSTAR